MIGRLRGQAITLLFLGVALISSLALYLRMGIEASSNADNPPTVRIIAPSDEQNVSGRVLLAAEANGDHGVDHVAFYVGPNAQLAAVVRTAPYRVLWDSTPLSKQVSHGYERGPIGLDALAQIERLPYLRDGVQAHQISSHDPSGGNFDRGHYLRREGNEYVLLDVEGPGCIYNIWFSSLTFDSLRFYFDGETIPRLHRRAQEIFSGTLAPFLAPLAGNAQVSSGGYYSMVPMPFASSCRITSDGEPRYYHILYHTYASADGVRTFTGREDTSTVSRTWQNPGQDPKNTSGNMSIVGQANIKPGRTATLAQIQGAGSIASLKLNMYPPTAEAFNNTWLRAHWDRDETPSIHVPVGPFFGSGLGPATVRGLLIGMTADGSCYCYFPMPYWESARIELYNAGRAPIAVSYEIQYSTTPYEPGKAAYFHARYRQQGLVPDGSDYLVLDTSGKGHLVGTVLTMAGGTPGNPIYMEGDERIYLDGSASPAVYGTGTEDYFLGAWFFQAGIFTLPTHGFPIRASDSLERISCYRLHIGDCIPFSSAIRFGIEHGDQNLQAAEYSSVAYYYHLDIPQCRLTDYLDVGDTASEAAHRYTADPSSTLVTRTSYYEGDNDNLPLQDAGRATLQWSAFDLAISPLNRGVLLVRRRDQSVEPQRATIHVDEILAGTWYTPYVNRVKSWSDETLILPATFTAGKERVRIAVNSSGRNWNEFAYKVYSCDTCIPIIARAYDTIGQSAEDMIWVRVSVPQDNAPSPIVPEHVCSPPGASQSFTAVYTATNAWPNIRYADLLINATETTTNCIYVRYDARTNQLFLRRPDDKAWMGGKAPGSAGAVKHVFGALDFSRSAVITGAAALTVTWAITPTWRMSGQMHNLYLKVEDTAGESSGWKDYGDWAVNRAPTWLIPPRIINQFVPAGVRITLDPRYRDLDGWRTWHKLYLAITNDPPVGEMMPGGVFLKYDQLQDRIYLANSAGTAWLPAEGAEAGSPAVLENVAAKLILQWSNTGLADAKTRIVRWRLEFKPDFVGRHAVYLRGVDNLPECSGDTGWIYKGWLEVTAPQVPTLQSTAHTIDSQLNSVILQALTSRASIKVQGGTRP